MSIFLTSLMLTSLLFWSPNVQAADGDNDGFDDSVDDCPFAAGTSTNGLMGCPDINLDGIADSTQYQSAFFEGAGRDYDSNYGTDIDEDSGGISEYTNLGGWQGSGIQVRAIDVAPNGKVVLGSDSGNHVYLALTSGHISHSLFTMDSDPRGLDFSANGSLLAACGYGIEDAGDMANVHIYQMNWFDESVTHLVNLSANHHDDTFALKFSPDGSRLFVGGKDHSITVYDTSTWQILRIIELGADDVYNTVPSPDGRLLAITHGQELSVYWTSNGTQLYNVHNHTDVVLGLDWSPDGRWIITGGNDGRFRVYHAENGTQMLSVNQGSDVNAVAFNRAGTHFVLATDSGSTTSIYSTSDWSNEYYTMVEIGDFPGGSGNGASGRRGARDVAWSLDEKRIHFGAKYYGGFYTFYSVDSFIWMGGDVTGQLMETRFREYANVSNGYMPNHFNSSINMITHVQCNMIASTSGVTMGAGATTSAESLTNRNANYSSTGLRTCNSNGDSLVDIPVARMPATLMVKANGAAQQCVTNMGGISMGQLRWMLSGASASTLSTSGVHPGVVFNSIVPNDDGDGLVEWRDLDSSCQDEPIHTYHRWENRSVTQMISAMLFCDHCSFPEDWYEPSNSRLRLVQSNRGDIVNGVANYDGAIGITELRVGLNDNTIYNVPIINNWTHGSVDAIQGGQAAIMPSVEESRNGTWPFQDNYYLTVREDQVNESRDFITWMLSESGQENFDEIGFVSMDPFSRVASGDRIGVDLRHILPDDDGDGVWNGDDNCPNTDSMSVVDSSGCAQNQLDDDGDGFVNTIDDCPNTYGTSSQLVSGCPDTDGDGWADVSDAFPSEPTQWSDSDGDGYGDQAGFQEDVCPDTYGLSSLDRYGCLDSDLDGWSDLNDVFPNNPSQWADADGDGVGDNYTWVLGESGIRQNEAGDAFPSDISQHKDRDGDGYGDNSDGFLPDSCPDVLGTSNQNGRLGCIDADGDGWADIDDAFPSDDSQHSDVDGDGYGDNPSGLMADSCRETPYEEIALVDTLGCAPSERDGDYDGINDAEDLCPTTPISEVLEADINGCSNSERDTDGDGAIDSVDQYPNDSTQSVDADGDGYGDNSSGFNGDDCLGEFGTSSANLRGCVDTDDDGWADFEDILTNNPTQWNDTDGDGYYDNFAIVDWRNDEMRLNNSWPGQYIPNAKDSDRCPLLAYELQNLENPGCPPDVFPAGEPIESGPKNNQMDAGDSSGGISATVVILVGISVILLISIGGGITLILRKPKSKKRETSRASAQKTVEQVYEGDIQESESVEDDPNYKVDENGCEWWMDDEGNWWYRLPEMDDWAEYNA